MYVPKHFSVEGREALNTLIRANPFGLLVGELEGSPFATHLPFLLDGDRLLSHFARGNPHWKPIDGQTEMLAVFSGPHAYVSPRWYESKQAVPTWNYAAVHVYGAPRVIEDAGEVRVLLDRLVREYEGDAWSLDGQDADFTDRMSRGIVAFEMPIERIEGKFKLSQNRPVEDRHRVIAAFEAPGDGENADLARLMRAALDGD
ncbi:MAG: FMN-binding negative transcriptional regulator [Proteobacteria bacterium]|nr:FMN-binding negative transcriptional regulator [Pseudomonadota bacterium]MCK4867628.1 FMN-binding negative transcriptional regulator [Alphaproteobacteria bacterium]